MLLRCTIARKLERFPLQKWRDKIICSSLPERSDVIVTDNAMITRKCDK